MAARFVLLLAAGAAAQDVGGPPPFFQYAKTARWIVHNSTWGTLSTISTRKGLEGRPFGNPNSIADGPTGGSTRGHRLPRHLVTVTCDSGYQRIALSGLGRS